MAALTDFSGLMAGAGMVDVMHLSVGDACMGCIKLNKHIMFLN